MSQIPDFYLTAAGEFEPLQEPRRCSFVARLRDAFRDDYMLVEIAPPLPGQRFGLGGKEIDSLILSTRHEGQTLFPISEWPSYVYVARLLDESIVKNGVFRGDQVELIAKATLYPSIESAALPKGARQR